MARATDLFEWRRANDIETRRAELVRRIREAKPRSRTRIELETRLKFLTLEALDGQAAQLRHPRFQKGRTETFLDDL